MRAVVLVAMMFVAGAGSASELSSGRSKGKSSSGSSSGSLGSSSSGSSGSTYRRTIYPTSSNSSQSSYGSSYNSNYNSVPSVYQTQSHSGGSFQSGYNSYNGSSYGYGYGSRSELKPPSGPMHPPVMLDFRDKFATVINNYVAAQYQLTQGIFLIKDDQTGENHRLKLSAIHKDRIEQIGPTDAFGCLEFERVGDGKKLDLDFYLSKEGWDWNISKIYIHSVDGKPRYDYDSKFQIVAVGGGAPAGKPAPVARDTAAVSAVPKPKAPAKLTAQVSFSEPSGNNRLDGDETGKLLVTVTNAGPGPAYGMRLEARLKTSVKGLSLPGGFSIGELKAGKSVSTEIPLAAGSEIASQKIAVEVLVREGNGFDSEPILVELETRAFKAPRLEIAGVILRGGKVVRAGDTSPVAVTVRNSGTGAARNVAVSMMLGSPDLFMSGDPTYAIGTLEPGESKTVDFEFFVNKRFKGSALPVTVALNESKGRYGVAGQSLGLVLGQAAPTRVQSVQGFAEAEPAARGPEVENVDAPPRSKTKLDPEAYAVVVGIEKYRDVPGVDYAARDAEAVYAYLTRSMGFDSKNIVLLTNERATLTDLATYLGPWLQDRVSAKSRVFIFYAGHGAPDPKSGKAYLVPYDGNPNYNETKSYPVSRLYETLAKLPAAEVTVALDACFSGAGGRSVLAKGARPLVHSQGQTPTSPNIVVLSAASGDQISTYYPEAQHGLMTYFLLKGLRGAADADKNNDITTSELFSYVSPAVEREARKQHIEQTPTLNPSPQSLGDKGDRVWLRLR